MVTVTQTPIGIKIIDQIVSATIGDSSGDALVTLTGHSLTTGDYIFLESDVDEYNGMWYVTEINGSTFKISQNSAGPFVEYFQDTDIEYYQTFTHVWSSIFLPIIYKATNDLWPVNTVDSEVGVVSQEDDNGYTKLTLSGVTGAGPLEYVVLNDGTVHQVIELDPPTLTINKLYDSTSVITTVQKYYNNYQVRVKIFAGLPFPQMWEARKPLREVAELSLTPDADNNVMFSVSDYIKALVTIRNNPLLFSMPLNLDAFTGFYISTAESYETADGYSITNYESDFEDNQFVGYAVAGVLPFKNRYSGQYSDYIYTSGSPAKWLNTLTTLIGVVGNYFDISFIKNIGGAFIVIIDKYANNYRYETESIEYPDSGFGVYRIPITFVSEYDQFCVRVQRPEVAARGGSALDLTTMFNACDASWVLGANPSITVPCCGDDSGYLTMSFDSYAGIDHTFSFSIDVSSGGSTAITVIRILMMDSTCEIIQYEENSYIGSGTKTGTVVLNPPVYASTIAIWVKNVSLVNDKMYTVNSFTFEGSPGSPQVDITEEICIDIYEVCGFDDGAVIQPTAARRLLEDGGFRLLEE
jgi:hypothetical protein